MRNVEIEMAMDLCIEDKDEERESEAQPAVPGGKRELKRGGRADWRSSPPARFFALTTG